MNHLEHDVTPPHIVEAIRKRQLRRRIWERFEFAFFVGLMLTLVAAGVTFTVSHLMASTDHIRGNFLDEDNGELMVIDLPPKPIELPPETLDAQVAVDISWMEDDDSVLIDPYLAPKEVEQIQDGYVDSELEDIDLSQVADFSLPNVGNVADLSDVPDVLALDLASIYGTIRRGGRTNDVRTVYKYPSLVWGIFAED